MLTLTLISVPSEMGRLAPLYGGLRTTRGPQRGDVRRVGETLGPSTVTNPRTLNDRTDEPSMETSKHARIEDHGAPDLYHRK